MTPLYEVWGAADPDGYCWSRLWIGQEPIRLPLVWAREFARELFEQDGLPVEVRGYSPNNQNRVRVRFGANHWESLMVDQ
jgi:hypothetical protein